MSIHRQAIKKLASADYLVIEKEHTLLEKYLADLRDACTCSNTENLPDCQLCDQEKQASCQGRLASFLFAIVDLAHRHFANEEAIMLSRPHITTEYKYFRIHKQAHADIMQKLYALSDECLSLRNQDNIAKVFSRFHKTLSDLFTEHDSNFDDPFIESTITPAT